jgi:hypothetical protein
MNRSLLATVLFFVLPFSLTGQDLLIQRQASALPSDARFEIFQSPTGEKWTLMLDRVTGNVQRLQPGKSGNLVWEKMKVLPHPKAVNLAKPHFQIFVSNMLGIGEVTLLLDTESGATWKLLPKVGAGLWQTIE